MGPCAFGASGASLNRPARLRRAGAGGHVMNPWFSADVTSAPQPAAGGFFFLTPKWLRSAIYSAFSCI